MLPQEVIELACQQSRAFEEKLRRADMSTGGGGAGGAGGEAGMSGTMRGVLCSFFDRLVSIANSDLSVPELACVAQQMFHRYQALTLAK
jgi:hypothetical protein